MHRLVRGELGHHQELRDHVERVDGGRDGQQDADPAPARGRVGDLGLDLGLRGRGRLLLAVGRAVRVLLCCFHPATTYNVGRERRAPVRHPAGSTG